MKRFILLVVFCLGCLVANGVVISEKQLKRIKRSVDINSVKDKTIRINKEKVEILEIFSSQDQDSSFDFEMRIAIELTDEEGNSYLVESSKPQGEVASEYTGEDAWQLQIARGELKRPKISAYVVQYGLLANEEFIPIAEDTDDVDTLEELKARTSATLEQKPVLLHHYSYQSYGTSDNGGGNEVLWSDWE